MAVILSVQVSLINTDVQAAHGKPEVLIQTGQERSLQAAEALTTDSVWLVAQKALEDAVNAVGDDAMEQMRIGERNARAMQARGEI